MLLPRPNRSTAIARAKRELDEAYGEAPPEPFLGWHARGYVPHCDKPGLIQLVTFRLNDAMPAERRHEWEALNAIQDERDRRIQLEAYLDRGYGQCYLARPKIAEIIENTFLFHDAQRYRLCAWVIMPNHVHVLFEVWDKPMGDVLYSWKRFTAQKANTLLGLQGRFWQKEYWDRYMRDEEHVTRARHYVESNPVKARLSARIEDWRWSSANPKWTWDVGRGGDSQPHSRYYGGHLASENWQRFLSQARPR